jgi:NADPH:quinone reductase-like Zn-dependent oxidoreductase
MKAIVFSKRNAPNSINYTDIEKPVPTAGQVLVKIHSVSLNAADYRSMQMGIGPKSGIFGADIAGLVEAVGPDTKKFKVGDAVFGDISGCGFGGLSEYVAVPENVLATKPGSVSFENAAALPMASVTALQALRDKGKIKLGDRVLLVGASGGVGLYALQLAKYFGAHVTAVCSPRNAETITALGADDVIYYTRTKLSSLRGKFDIILGINGSYSLFTYRKLLASGGVWVGIGGAISQFIRVLFLGPLLSLGKTKMRILYATPNTEDLMFIMSLVEAARIRPVIDRRYSLPEAAEAFKYISAGHAGGKVIVNVIS